MPFFVINEQPQKQVFDGASIRTLHGEKIMMSFVDLKPHSVVAEHSHPHEQMGMVLEGTFELTIDGDTRILQKGDCLPDSLQCETQCESSRQTSNCTRHL